jgi:hypothetical protein
MKPVKLRLWVELVAAISGIACVLAIFFATVGAATGDAADDSPAASPPASAAQPVQIAHAQPISAAAVAETPNAPLQTYEGVVADTHCGAKHSPKIDENAADCTRACVHAGQHFALVDGDKVYVLEGQEDLLKRAAGVRVTITGALSNNTISVASVRLPSP